MSENKKETGLGSIAEIVIRRVLENIESPFVWMPFGLFVLCLLASVANASMPFFYLTVLFAVITLFADWVGKRRNRRTPPLPLPTQAGYREEILTYISDLQLRAIQLMEQRKRGAAQALIERNMAAIEDALRQFPDDADFHSLLGYTLKDFYQNTKGLIPSDLRRRHLARARASFERALSIDPNNAGAHNGFGNVLFFEGLFDDAIREHDKALAMTGGDYEAARGDRDLVISVKNKVIPFDF